VLLKGSRGIGLERVADKLRAEAEPAGRGRRGAVAGPRAR
jgi:hypothetical protein